MVLKLLKKFVFRSYKTTIIVVGISFLLLSISITSFAQQGGCEYRLVGGSYLCVAIPGASSYQHPIVPDNTAVTQGNTTYYGDGYQYIPTPGITYIPGDGQMPSFTSPTVSPSPQAKPLTSPSPSPSKSPTPAQTSYQGQTCDTITAESARPGQDPNAFPSCNTTDTNSSGQHLYCAMYSGLSYGVCQYGSAPVGTCTNTTDPGCAGTRLNGQSCVPSANPSQCSAGLSCQLEAGVYICETPKGQCTKSHSFSNGAQCACADDCQTGLDCRAYSGGAVSIATYCLPPITPAGTNNNASGGTNTGIAGGNGSTCDPVEDGKIDENDFNVWKQEYLHAISTTRSACMSPNKTVDLLGFQAWKNIHVLKITNTFP